MMCNRTPNTIVGRSTVGFLFALSAAALVSSVAFAAVKFKLSGATKVTETAGKANNSSPAYLGATGDFRGMWKLEGREKNDAPALISWDRHLNNFDTKRYVQNSWTTSAGSPKTIGFDDSDTYIRGVAVCLNKAKSKIKGVKIWGAKVNRNNGVLNTISTPKKWERTNCKYWGEAKYCPGGKIATRMRVYGTAPNGAGHALGIALECRTVGPK